MQNKPHVPASTRLPEITIKSVILAVILGSVLSGANAYLGLFAGLTVSASIPAAVLSMGILRLFRNSNILENNGVQTAASAGESLAAGVIFTFPALVLMGYWDSFNYWETALIALCGGVLGVLFTIPLRRSLIIEQKLAFPEGVATSEVLKSGEEGGKAIWYLVWASLAGAFLKFAASGWKLYSESLEYATIQSNKLFLYFGINLSPALMAVGYIVGLQISFLVFLGGVLSWWVAIPIWVGITGVPEGMTAVQLGNEIWDTKIRYLGVGAMVIGGLWALVSLRSSISGAFMQGVRAFSKAEKSDRSILRTEKDTPMKWVMIGILLMIIPILLIYFREIRSAEVTGLMTLIMVVAGFLFSAVAGYMAGLVGSSNNPISGVTIATILFASLLLLAFLGEGPGGPAAAIMIGAVVCCAAAISGDNLQDLKAGHILGATPYKLQIMQMLGVTVGAFSLPPVLSLLHNAYGFGAKTAEHPSALAAPQASLMESVASGVFGAGLPWDWVTAGILVGAAIIAFDQHLKKKGSNFRMPVLAVAVGLYLPYELDSSIMVGGLVAWVVSRAWTKMKANPQHVKNGERSGLLFASGLITGEALVGILLAIPISISGNPDVFKLSWQTGNGIGAMALIGICLWLRFVAVRAARNPN